MIGTNPRRKRGQTNLKKTFMVSISCKPKIEKGRLEPSMLAGQASILLARRSVSSSVKVVMVTCSLYCQPRLKFLKLEEPA
uniref:Uncharacterized protein n=1 Tax=Salix viminalis TaxID=40686 RepID=A0A6N2M160_SALVM